MFSSEPPYLVELAEGDDSSTRDHPVKDDVAASGVERLLEMDEPDAHVRCTRYGRMVNG